jgi:endonuclease/exonuclease/phosphatase family metal-dependent hydrolase
MNATQKIGRRVVADLSGPGPRAIAAIRAAPATQAEHARFVRELGLFDAIEVTVAPTARAPAHASVRVLFWNAERCKYLSESAALIRAAAPDLVLLAEMDRGMARSANRHTTRDLAQALAMGSLFAVEYLELDLGDARERAWHAGQANSDALHGNAILSTHTLNDPAVIRLDDDGKWFDGAFDERRIGGRMALAATLPVSGVNVLFVSVHFESHSDPAHRAEQMRILLDGVDALAHGGPAVIGGDFNTNTFGRGAASKSAVAAALARDPRRLVAPVAWEPMFALAAARGFAWSEANPPDTCTQRTRPDGTPAPPFGRIDWFFTRGLAVSDAGVVPAVAADGSAISDHEALAITVRLQP